MHSKFADRGSQIQKTYIIGVMIDKARVRDDMNRTFIHACMRGLKSYQRRAGMKEWFAETNMWFNNINIDKKRLSGFSFKA